MEITEYQIHNSAGHLVAVYREDFFYAEGDDAKSAANRNLAKLNEMFPEDTFTLTTR